MLEQKKSKLVFQSKGLTRFLALKHKFYILISSGKVFIDLMCWSQSKNIKNSEKKVTLTALKKIPAIDGLR